MYVMRTTDTQLGRSYMTLIRLPCDVPQSAPPMYCYGLHHKHFYPPSVLKVGAGCNPSSSQFVNGGCNLQQLATTTCEITSLCSTASHLCSVISVNLILFSFVMPYFRAPQVNTRPAALVSSLPFGGLLAASFQGVPKLRWPFLMFNNRSSTTWTVCLGCLCNFCRVQLPSKAVGSQTQHGFVDMKKKNAKCRGWDSNGALSHMRSRLLGCWHHRQTHGLPGGLCSPLWRSPLHGRAC